MPTRRLLYLSNHQMNAFRWKAGVLVGEGLFEATEAGHQQFAAYLKARKRSLFALLTNVAEEGFQIDTIPFLNGADRKAIIGRKLGQLFFNASLTTSLSLGYEKSRRRDERIMLTALTNTAFFDPWLKAINETGVALSGLYSLPLMGATLLKKLGLLEERCLLLTVQDQSIRQSYFEKGELHFSRLTLLQNSSIAGLAQSFATEAFKLQQYLASQRLVGRGQPITAHILAHSNALKAIKTSCIDTDTLTFDILDTETCAGKIGLKTLPLDTHSELLFIHLLATAPPRTQFANDVQRRDFHLWQIRSGLYGLGAVVSLACLLFAGKQTFEAYSITQETDALKAEASISRQRYNDIVKTFPPIPTNNDTLRRVINRYADLEKKNTSPEGLYQEISKALQSAASVDLESIDWKVGSAAALPGAGANPLPGAAQIDEDSEAAIIRGTIRLGANANARQLLALYNQLVTALKANPKLQVKELQRPIDTESGKSLKIGDTTMEDDKPRTFSLQISRKIRS
jgi:hypothetical protein